MGSDELELNLGAPASLRGSVTLPGDKSLSHRAALFAAMAEGESVVRRFLVSGVTRAMLDALSALGVAWRLDGDSLRVTGRGLRGFHTPRQALDCGNSATTMRMLLGALSAAGAEATLDGSAGLRQRPMGRVTTPLQTMGVRITSADGCAPLVLVGRAKDLPLKAVSHVLPVASAQVKSALVLAALAGDGVTEIREPGPSRDHTERMLRSMGAEVESVGDHTVRVSPLSKPLQPLDMTLPGDISSAAFLMVAAAIVPGSAILLRNVGLNHTRTGFSEVLKAMGAEIEYEACGESAGEAVGDIRLNAAALRGVRVGGDTVVRMIDEFPALAVAACFAEGVTDVHDAGELRYKESDRIAVMCRELRSLGAVVEERADGFSIQGGSLRGGVCEARGDHRLAMSLALAGLAAPEPVRVRGAEILNESFPGFLPSLRRLGVENR